MNHFLKNNFHSKIAPTLNMLADETTLDNLYKNQNSIDYIEHYVIDKEIDGVLKDFCLTENVDVQYYLFSIFNLFFHRISGEKQFTTWFLNPALKFPTSHTNNFDANISLKTIMGSASSNALEMNSFEYVNLKQALSENETKLINVLFEFKNSDMPTSLSSDKFDLILTIEKNHSNFELHIKCKQNILTQDTLKQWIEIYLKLVYDFIGNLEKNIGFVGLLKESQIETILKKTNTAEAYSIPNIGVHQLFQNQVEKNKSNIAIIDKEKYYTYEQVEIASNKLANFLIRTGVEQGNTVAILLPASYELIVCILAILKIGAKYTPLSTEYPENRIKSILDQATVKALITNSAYESIFKENFNTKLINLEKEKNNLELSHDEKPTVKVCSEDIAYTLFTSGSTGQPKGIEISHLGLLNLISSTQKFYNLKTNEKVLYHTPIVFDASVLDIYWPLSVGATVVILEEAKYKNINEIINCIEKYKVNMIQFVPLMLDIFIRAVALNANQKINSLRIVIVGGSSLSKKTRDNFYKNISCKLYNHYGPTECSVDVARFDTTQVFSSSATPIGKSINNAKIYVLDEYGWLCPPGIPGELYISSYGNAKGYLNLPEKSKETFIKNKFNDGFSNFLFKTSDKAVYLEDGNIIVLGRLDNQVKVNGNRIELEEIEQKLLLHPQISNCAVFINNAASGVQKIIAFISLHDNNFNSSMPGDLLNIQPTLYKALLTYLKQYIPFYMLPNNIYFMHQLPQLISGKNNREKIKSIFNELITRGDSL